MLVVILVNDDDDDEGDGDDDDSDGDWDVDDCGSPSVVGDGYGALCSMKIGLAVFFCD